MNAAAPKVTEIYIKNGNSNELYVVIGLKVIKELKFVLRNEVSYVLEGYANDVPGGHISLRRS